MATVQLRGFRGGNGTVDLNDAENVASVLKRQGIDSTGITVMLNETAISEADLKKITLRDGDVLRATVKAIGGTDDEPAGEAAPADIEHEAASDPAPAATDAPEGDLPAQD